MMNFLFILPILISSVAWSNSKELNEAYSIKADLEEKFENRIKKFINESNLHAVKGSKVDIVFMEENFIKAFAPPVENKVPDSSTITNSDSELSPLVKFDFDKKSLSMDERKGPSVYKFFKNINVTIYFSPESKAAEREKILEFIKNNYSKFMGIIIKYESKESFPSRKEKKLEKKFFEDRNNLILIGITILIFFAIFVHWLAGFFLYRGLVKVSKSLLNAGESFSKVNDIQTEKLSDPDPDPGGELRFSRNGQAKNENENENNISFSSYEGVKKFKDLLSTNTKIAHQMLKIWLSTSDRISFSACLMILRSLSIQQVTDFFKILSFKEKNIILKMVNSKEVFMTKEADHLILSKISSDLIYAEMIKDQDLIRLIQTTSPDKLTSLIKNNIEAGSYIIQLLGPEISNNVFNNLPDETFFELIDFKKSNEIPDNILNYLTEKLKSSELQVSHSSNLTDNFLELIKNCVPEREEGILLKSLKYFNQQQILSLILEYVPLFLIKQFSPEIKFIVFKKLTNNDKIRFLLIQDETECLKFLDFTGEKGSKVRKVYEVDLEIRRSQPVFMDKIKKDEQNIWFLYADVLRKLILTDVNVRDYVYQFSSKWIEENQNKNKLANISPPPNDSKAA